MVGGGRRWTLLRFLILSSLAVLRLGEVATSAYFEPFNVSYDHRALIIGGNRRMLNSAGIHYPRATPEMWPHLIAKSKEGGAEVVQTYIFWNKHEPVRGQYYFGGRYDIVKFVKLVGAAGLYLHLRIGPYVCAEWNFGSHLPSIMSLTHFFGLLNLFLLIILYCVRIFLRLCLCLSLQMFYEVLYEVGETVTYMGIHTFGVLWNVPDKKFYDLFNLQSCSVESFLSTRAIIACRGFPVWLRDIPGIKFRTDNAPFKEEMERFVKKIVALMREEMLFSWQGGPIILLQIENEYGNIESKYGESGKNYVKWAAEMALGLGAGVPWVMCRQVDAPGSIINACNGYYCDGFRPNSANKPTLWTEDWDGWYASWGGRLPHRPVEDLAFAVARFFQRGGSFQNYYMYFGGTNFGRTSGGPFYITSYDYDAPLDEFGLISQPKWGHLKDLHAAIKLCERALVFSDAAHLIKLGEMQEAHVYNGTEGKCAAFVANIDEHRSATVHFLGKAYSIPPWSVSILPDCKNIVFNTAKVAAQTSIKSVAVDLSLGQKLSARNGHSHFSKSWMSLVEPIALWSNDTFTVQDILEHLNVTKDHSDYLWYFTRIHVSDDDVAFWAEKKISPTIEIDSMRDVFRVFVNGQLAGSVVGHWVKVVQPIKLQQGYNDLVLLSQTVGLQNYGAFLEKDGAGFRGKLKLTGFMNGDIDLSKLSWTYQVGLYGEFMKIYSVEENEKAEWTDLVQGDNPSTFTWYKTYFDSPEGIDPVALNLGSMGKGQAWVNGHHIGRYWNSVAPKDGCKKCDYRGPYGSEKCRTNCGQPTQTRYHVPRSWLQASGNFLVIFEEMEGNPSDISVELHYSEIVCGQLSETHYPPLHKWSYPDSVSGEISLHDRTPELYLNCEEGHAIGVIEFASYGTPKGSCPSFQRSSCHAVDSERVVTEACLGRNSCSIRISNTEFGGDPCRGIVKTLAVQARCVSSTSSMLLLSEV